MSPTLTPDQWRTVLNNTILPTFGELVQALDDSDMVAGDPERVVEQATADAGCLTIDREASGMFDVYRLASENDYTTTELNQQPTHDDPDVLVNDDAPTNDAETAVAEGGSGDVNPTPEAGKTASPTADTAVHDSSAIADALEWFSQQLDRELPNKCDYDTPREYYCDGRGWDADTIAEKRLGYAPANCRDELMAYLFNRGHDRAAIISTGLFGERDDGNLYTTWNGRYVLPYVAEGRPVFAISRATDPVHPADWKGNKYDKLQVSREDVSVEEPIYGVDTVREGEAVLITEGIADAITAHEAGYPCLSPVTVQFKNSDRERLLDVLAERDVSRVYLIQDAERPTSNVDDRDRLALQQFGSGVKGAVKTGAYLSDHGLEARIADLPRPGLDKVDLDDYIHDWNDDLTPLLASAKPVDQHPAYDADTAKSVALDAASSANLSRDIDAIDSNGNHSALFDLTIRDVSGLDWSYRGVNPLGHHGDSETYFVLLEAHGVAYDHKYKVAYNSLTYLLVDAGERRASSPNGRLEDSEVFAAWKHAKQCGCIPDNDPIPHRALQYVAREHGHADGEDIIDGWKLPREAYNATLATVRERYGVEAGRDDIPTGEAEHTAVLPAPNHGLTAPTTGWDWRHTAEQTTDTLTVGDARKRTTEAIADAYTSHDRVLIEALPTMGKSYGAIKAAAETGEPVTVLTGRGHKEQYDQFKQWCDDLGLSYYRLPSFMRDCETANGEHGQEWADKVSGVYARGATPQQIHKSAEHVFGEPLPCQQGEHTCSYTAKWDFDPDDYDVLIGHYSHAYRAEKVVHRRAVVLDEFPSAYENEIGPELQGAVSYWLKTTPGVPFDSHTDLLENRDDDDRRGEALAWFDQQGVETDENHVFDDPKAHAAAPLAVYTLLAGNDLGNGFEAADLGNVGHGAFDRDRGVVSVLRPPKLTYASAVVGLDGTPTKRMWQLSLNERVNHRKVLQGDERAEYIRDALNLNLVRTSEYVKSYNSPDHVNATNDAALLEAIAEAHDEKPGVITSSTAEGEYREAGVDDLADETKHYGNVLGSNEFKSKRVGAVIGSNHYGDDYIKKWGAYAGVTVKSPDRSDPSKRGNNLSYGQFGDRVLTHMREHDTLQAAMRFGRDGNGAVVYVHTDTLPEWVPIAAEGRVITTWSEGMKAVVGALDDLNTATTAEIVEHPDVSLSRQQVFAHLETLRERGVLTREQDVADGRRVVWCDDGLHRLGDHGDVELETIEIDDLTESEVRQVARSSIYTWNLTNLTADDDVSVDRSIGETATPSQALAGGVDTPPDDAD